MIGVCLPYTNNYNEQRNWDYLLSNFKVDEIFIIGKEGQEIPYSNVYGNGTFITNYNELPHTSKIVLLAPKHGKNIQGTIEILDFVHPTTDVIYIVGSNNTYIEVEDFESKPIDDIVYVETDTTDDMFNWTAMTVTLFDRRRKTKVNG